MKKSKAIYGVATSLFGHRMALTAAKVKRLAGTGIDMLEFSGLQPIHVNVFDDERLDELAGALRESGLRAWSYHAPFCSIAMDDEETRMDGVRLLIRSALAAKRIGAEMVVVHPGRDVASVDRDRERTWTVDGLRRAIDGLPDGVRLALETMPSETGPAGTAEEMLRVMEALPRERIGVCVDTGHVHLCADPSAWIRAFSGRIASVHLQDNRGDKDDHMLPGDGTIRWPEVLAALRDAAYAGPFMMESAAHSRTPEDNAREFVRRMKAFGAEATSGTH